MISNFDKSNILRKKASFLIPGGAHTYSKGDDQFPQLSPHSIVKGKGAKIWDVDGNEFIDWGMGLTSVLLGHAYDPILDVIKKELDNGCNFIRPSFLEAEVAELISNQIPSAEMVKFGKNGSNATTAAVKLARAYTGKEIVLRCFDQPFFSIDDWFIGDTEISSGVTQRTKSETKHFKYNDLDDLKNKIDEYKKAGIACVILEPAATEEPKEGYLQNVKDLCEKEGIVLIFDEVVSGFRFHPRGAQYLYGVTPHLSTFGKAIANGFSISALVGRRDIMKLGGLEHDQERVFLLSTTYGGETHHLRATQKNIEILNQNNYEVTKYVWDVGKKIKDSFNSIAENYSIQEYAKIMGVDCRPYFYFKDNFMRTLFQQEMIKNGVLAQSINPSFSHRDSEISQTIEAFERSLKLLALAIETNKVNDLLVGPPIKPVFRKFN
jgi:glutamate-1-semialdehyde 2,1-aminotransferase